jgi:aerobic carbon-monoxide dehydrogenase medium subunit
MLPAPHDLPHPGTEAAPLPTPAVGSGAAGTSRVLAGRRHLVALPGRQGPAPAAGGDDARVVRRAGRVHVGAAVGTATALAAPPVRAHLPLVAAALARSCRPPVRDRETVVGSLCCADPASALAAAAVALDAEFTVERADGTTAVVPAAEFFLDPLRVALPQGAAVRDVSFPVAGPGAGAGLHQLCRSSCDGPHVAAAVQLVVRGGAVTDARVAVVGAGSPPVRVPAVEAALTGAPPTGDRLRAAARLVDPAGRRFRAGRRGRELTVVVARSLRTAAEPASTWERTRPPGH